jgi:GT2 family glycosyltransferase
VSSISLIIPTFDREQVLLDTVHALFSLPLDDCELLIVDQTTRHDDSTTAALRQFERDGRLRWIRLSEPSIPHAMNTGLRTARHDLVLFLDDDIVPATGLIKAHAAAYDEFPDATAVVGQVLQPGEVPGVALRRSSPRGLRDDLDFPFWSSARAWVANVMAGNLSVKRERALAIGGFDENFAGVAYRFETEFSRRIIRGGGRILFEPAASLRHLRAERGGTRSQGSHLTSASPRHGMGDYYFAMQSGWSAETVSYMLRRPFREVATRFHARHPWYIPVKLLGEVRAFAAAWSRHRRGPKLIEQACDSFDNPQPPTESSMPESVEGAVPR